MENVILKVEGMSCGLCAMSIESALFELDAKGGGIIQQFFNN